MDSPRQLVLVASELDLRADGRRFETGENFLAERSDVPKRSASQRYRSACRHPEPRHQIESKDGERTDHEGRDTGLSHHASMRSPNLHTEPLPRPASESSHARGCEPSGSQGSVPGLAHAESSQSQPPAQVEP